MEYSPAPLACQLDVQARVESSGDGRQSAHDRRISRRRLRLAGLLVRSTAGGRDAARAPQAPSIVVRPDGRLDVSAPPAAAVMRYTLDGTDPTRDAGEWLAPVRVPPGYTVKARAVAADGTPVGAVATWTCATRQARARRRRSCR